MAELDPLIAEVLLKGDDEFLGKLKKVGTEGAEAFEKINKAVEAGKSSFEVAQSSFLAIEQAISGVTAALIDFTEKQTEITQRMILLSNAFGTTAGTLQEIEAIFASAGVKVEQFERFANRLTITIAKEWPQIAESIKTYANENDAAQNRVTAAIFRVQDAQKALADNSEERTSRQVRNNQAIESSYIQLQFAAQKAAEEQREAYLSVQSASNGVIAAQQRLDTLLGKPPSDAQKKALEISQAQVALDQARAQEASARTAQDEKAAEASLKRAQQEQAFADLQRKASKDARDDAEQREKDELKVKEAIVARGEAEEKAAKFSRDNIASIRDALDGIVKGNVGAAKAIDLTLVSVQNLTKAIIAQAAETAKGVEPTGWETLRQIAKTFAADVEHLITQEQRLAIVNRLAGTSMQALGASAAEILNVLEHDADAIQNLKDKTDAFDTKKIRHDIEEFRGALASLNLTISLLSQQFAAAIAPAFTAFLNAVNDSITKDNGVIHEFIDGMKSLIEAFGFIVSKGADVIDFFTRLVTFGAAGKLDAFKAALIGIGVAITVATGPIGVMVVALGLVITAIGAIRDNWDKITESVKAAWDKVKDNAIISFLSGVLEIVVKIATKFIEIIAYIDKLTAIKAPNISGGGGGSSSPSVATEGHAEGGFISGPGTGTSDSILARLSNGEHVTQAKAVAFWGRDFMQAINEMRMPGFASGGYVGTPSRLASSGTTQPVSQLNLSIDGRSFNGLKGPKSTIDDLTSFAVSRQTSASGNNPSWMK